MCNDSFCRREQDRNRAAAWDHTGFDLSLVIIYATRYKYRTLNECCVIFPEISPVPVNPVNHPSLAVPYFSFPTKLFYFENDIVTTCGFIISKKKNCYSLYVVRTFERVYFW